MNITSLAGNLNKFENCFTVFHVYFERNFSLLDWKKKLSFEFALGAIHIVHKHERGEGVL